MRCDEAEATYGTAIVDRTASPAGQFGSGCPMDFHRESHRLAQSIFP